ncbi:DUF1576 domain-containing protein, partial [Enterococcus sp. S181_ASV_20]|nr:DUF1576 domain-containing protein [Enterococcus sp. S181_ASV_20]
MEKTKHVLFSTNIIFIFLLSYGLALTLSAFFLASPNELTMGMLRIIKSSSNLILSLIHISEP